MTAATKRIIGQFQGLRKKLRSRGIINYSGCKSYFTDNERATKGTRDKKTMQGCEEPVGASNLHFIRIRVDTFVRRLKERSQELVGERNSKARS
jgi:hypothetical protein